MLNELPHSHAEQALSLRATCEALLEEISEWKGHARERAAILAANLARAGWRWGEPIVKILGGSDAMMSPIAGMDTWRDLSKWEDMNAPAKPSAHPVEINEAQFRLAKLLGDGGETRPEQKAYVEAATYAFAPREVVGAPKLALVEAGTGVGKTLGYLSPASIWAEKNGPGLWISTYTRNLQRQIMQEIARLYPDPAEREEKAVVRKGRENYLCLLNFEDATKRLAMQPGQRAVALGLIARWIEATNDGDISGASFPAFLAASLPLREITDRRGECVYNACPHYRSCFIEKSIRRARHAPIVVANHALVIAQAGRDDMAIDQTSDTQPEKRTRFVFDEGHHLFDAADSGFAARLSGAEMAELRRWIRGGEGRGASRMRGLEERLKDIISGDDAAERARDEAIEAAQVLAGDGWMSRVMGPGARGPGEYFLSVAAQHIRAQGAEDDAAYTIETGIEALPDDLLQAAADLSRALFRLSDPMLRLANRLRKTLNEKASELETYQRGKIEAAIRGLERRAKLILPAWTDMLAALNAEEPNNEFCLWFEIARDDGRDLDVALERHWIDPTIPFASEILTEAHGVLITSATLRDAGLGETEWQAAEVRTGAGHLPEPARRSHFGSPFAYGEQARIFVVNDVARRDAEALSGAMRELFKASGGGALGLFTSIRTLRAVEKRISTPLDEAGIPLYAQHVDRLDTGALVDLFRAEEDACLLGTDALRDGVDVPGRSLRLVVFDKVPWPKPSILHKARRARFGKGYDDLLTRLRLKQAFGRLIRGAGDKGCFVILESAMPSRLLTAFPPDAPVRRTGLAETIAEIRGFLEPQG